MILTASSKCFLHLLRLTKQGLPTSQPQPDTWTVGLSKTISVMDNAANPLPESMSRHPNTESLQDPSQCVLEGEKPDTQLGHPAMPDTLLGQSPLGAVPARGRICDTRWDVASPFLSLSCLFILTLPTVSSSLGSSPFPSLPRCFGNRVCLFLSNILRIIISVHRLLVGD